MWRTKLNKAWETVVKLAPLQTMLRILKSGKEAGLGNSEKAWKWNGDILRNSNILVRNLYFNEVQQAGRPRSGLDRLSGQELLL